MELRLQPHKGPSETEGTVPAEGGDPELQPHKGPSETRTRCDVCWDGGAASTPQGSV